MNRYNKIEGLIAAVFTPMTEDCEVTLDLIPEYAENLKSRGVAGVFVNGSSGEGMLLSVDERKAAAEAWVRHADKDFKVIIHVGSTSVRVSQELARHSQDIGAAGIGCMAPSFLSSSDVNVIVDYCRQVAANAPGLPFYYYHLPVVTGAHIKVNQLLDIGSRLIPNLAGVKFTYNDFMDMHQCITLQDGRFDVLHGHDEVLINGLVLGIKGAIGTTFNFMPEVYNNIINAYSRNDVAAAKGYQMQSIKVVEVMLRYVNAVVGGKAIMKLSGIDCGPCRSPLRNLTEHEMTTLRAGLDDAGYFELIKSAGMRS